jgi:NADH-quinone oxidoreductase subunit L
VQNDIKRVVAYSTLSQLGYMTVALGASAYSAAIFHLMTHAFFKALLFLGAGSVIIAMHHEQDMRNMGGCASTCRSPTDHGADRRAGLRLPAFAGFFSKDSIIEAVHLASHAGRRLRLLCGAGGRVRHRVLLLPPVFPRLPRQGALPGPATMPPWHEHAHDAHGHDDGHDRPRPRHAAAEEPWVVTLPLVLLAIPSVYTGWAYIGPMLFGDFFGARSSSQPERTRPWPSICANFHGAFGAMVLHGLMTPPFWLALAGAATAWYCTWCARTCRRSSSEGRPCYTHPRAQIRLRPLQRLVLRRRRAPARHRPVEGGDQTLIDGWRQRLGAVVGWFAGAGAPVPVGLHLPLRVRHDHRRVRCC